MATYEVEVVIPEPMTEVAERFLQAAERSANRIIGFSGDQHQIRLTVQAAGTTEEEALRQAVREVAMVFPNRTAEFEEMREERSPSS